MVHNYLAIHDFDQYLCFYNVIFKSCIATNALDADQVVFCRAALCISFKNHQIFKQLQRGQVKYTSRFMRIWNEGATLILFAVIFLAITKSAVNWLYGLLVYWLLRYCLCWAFVCISAYAKKTLTRNGVILLFTKMMNMTKLSLRTRIFLSMIMLIFGASILIGAISVIQYKEEAEDYHTSRLLRKEDQIRAEISYVLNKTSFEVITEKIPIILKEKQDIYRISDVHELPLIFMIFKVICS